MPKYVIERELPGIGNVTRDQVLAISQKSCSVLNNLEPKIQWLHSYVTADRNYCVYIAFSERWFVNMRGRAESRRTGFQRSDWRLTPLRAEK